MTGRRAAPAPRPPRGGFTLLELVVALAILAGGLLALAAGAATTLRWLRDARLETEAAWLAARRLEHLRALPCAARLAGSATDGALVERWEVAPRADSTATRLEVVVHPAGDAARARTFVTVAPC